MAKVKNAILMVSSEGTGVFYITKKNPRKAEKLKLRKYDSKLRKHVEFTESKIARSKK